MGGPLPLFGCNSVHAPPVHTQLSLWYPPPPTCYLAGHEDTLLPLSCAYLTAPVHTCPSMCMPVRPCAYKTTHVHTTPALCIQDRPCAYKTTHVHTHENNARADKKGKKKERTREKKR